MRCVAIGCGVNTSVVVEVGDGANICLDCFQRWQAGEFDILPPPSERPRISRRRNRPSWQNPDQENEP